MEPDLVSMENSIQTEQVQKATPTPTPRWEEDRNTTGTGRCYRSGLEVPNKQLLLWWGFSWVLGILQIIRDAQ